MKALSLCSGIGGLDIACEWVGIKTAAFCDREEFPRKLLAKHWPGIPIYDDVYTLTKERMDADGIGPIDLIHAGYPCQTESYAGERRGADDDRWLWPEIARIVEEIAPDWVVFENVSGHITLGLDTVLDDLGRLNYTAQPFHIPAIAVDGDHERYRILIVAHSNGKPGLQTHQKISAIRKEWDAREDVGGGSWRPIPRSDWAVSGPPVSGSINGISGRMDRCIALGNAVNPYQVYPIFSTIKQIHDMLQ